MALTTYAELQSSIKNWLKRSGVTGISTSADMVVDFITLGEEELFSLLRVRSMESAGTLSCVAGTNTIALPTRFRAFKWLYVSGDPKIKLDLASGEQIFLEYAGSTNGKPKLFSYSADNLLLGPTPDSTYTIAYLAYIAPTALSGSATTNTLYPRYASLYLYASLKAAFAFLEDDAQVQKYGALLDAGIKRAMREDMMDRHSGGTLRARSAGATP